MSQAIGNQAERFAPRFKNRAQKGLVDGPADELIDGSS
jgi:hypothetical protein